MGGSQSSPEAMEAAKAVVSGAIAANPVVIFSKTYCERSHRPSAPLGLSCCQLVPAVVPAGLPTLPPSLLAAPPPTLRWPLAVVAWVLLGTVAERR